MGMISLQDYVGNLFMFLQTIQRYVMSLRGGSGHNPNPARPIHMRASRSFVGSTPGEYVTSLLRSRDHEDKDCLPVLDLYG